MGEDLLWAGNGTLELGFSPVTGALHRLRWAGSRESALGHCPDVPGLDARLGQAAWLGEHEPVEFVAHSFEAAEEGLHATITVRLGPLYLYDHYLARAGLIERQVTVENVGAAEAQLNGVRLSLPGARIGPLDACRFEAPATSFRPRLPLAMLAHLSPSPPSPSLPKLWERGVGDEGRLDEIAPAMRSRGRPMEDAPDISPGLMAVHNTGRNETLLCWYYSSVQAAAPRVIGAGGGVTLAHEVGLAGWLASGARLTAGTQFIQLHRGTWASALAAFRGSYTRSGLLPPVYGEPPAWVPSAAIYEVHPGPFGGFRGLMSEIPRLAELGITTLYLLPVQPYNNRCGHAWDGNWNGCGSPYAIKDFEAVEPTLGSAEDFRALVNEAHRHGLHVLADLVVQGSACDARMVSEHPEWYCRDEAGQFVSSHGWSDTYSFDWANPHYQEYMLGWSLRWVHEFDLDGYRVDAPFGKEPNWDRRIPYHASATNLGVVTLLERLQRGIKTIKPDAALLCEAFGPLFVRTHDFAYDYLPCVQLYELLDQHLTPWELGEWLRDYWAAMPEGAIRVSFIETHDTRGFHPPAVAWRGSQAGRAMLAALVMAGFVPMIWAGQERGQEDFYRRLLAARQASPALLRGERLFNVVNCDGEWVLSIVRRHEEEIVWGLVSLWPEKRTFTFALPRTLLGERLHPPVGTAICLHDLMTGRDWNEAGTAWWTLTDLERLQITPEPFQPYLFRLVRL